MPRRDIVLGADADLSQLDRELRRVETRQREITASGRTSSQQLTALMRVVERAAAGTAGRLRQIRTELAGAADPGRALVGVGNQLALAARQANHEFGALGGRLRALTQQQIARSHAERNAARSAEATRVALLGQVDAAARSQRQLRLGSAAAGRLHAAIERIGDALQQQFGLQRGLSASEEARFQRAKRVTGEVERQGAEVHQLAAVTGRVQRGFATIGDQVQATTRAQIAGTFAQREAEESARATKAQIQGQLAAAAALTNPVDRVTAAFERQLNIQGGLSAGDQARLNRYRRLTGEVERLGATQRQLARNARLFTEELQQSAAAARAGEDAIQQQAFSMDDLRRKARAYEQQLQAIQSLSAGTARIGGQAIRGGAGADVTANLQRRADAEREVIVSMARRLALSGRLNDADRDYLRTVERLIGADLRLDRAQEEAVQSGRRVITVHERMKEEAAQLWREYQRLRYQIQAINRVAAATAGAGGGGGFGPATAGAGGFSRGLRGLTRTIGSALTVWFALRSVIFAVERGFRLLVRAGRAVVRMLQRGAEFAGDLFRASRSLRFEISETLRLRQGVEALGLTFDQAGNLARELQEKAGRAIFGTSRTRLQARHLFRQLNLDLAELAEIADEPIDLLRRVFQEFENITNPVERAQVAAQLLGDQWRELVANTDLFVAALDRAERRQQLQGRITIDQAYAASLLNEEFAALGQFLRQVAGVVAARLYPSITRLIEALYEASGGVQNLAQQIADMVTIGILAIGRGLTLVIRDYVDEIGQAVAATTLLARIFKLITPAEQAQIHEGFARLTIGLAKLSEEASNFEGIDLDIRAPKGLETTEIQLRQNTIAYREGIIAADKYTASLIRQQERVLQATARALGARGAEFAVAEARARAAQAIEDRLRALRQEAAQRVRDIRELKTQNQDYSKQAEALQRILGLHHRLRAATEETLDKAGQLANVNFEGQQLLGGLRALRQFGFQAELQLLRLRQTVGDLNFEQSLQGLPTALRNLLVNQRQDLQGFQETAQLAAQELERFVEHYTALQNLGETHIGAQSLDVLLEDAKAAQVEIDQLLLDAARLTEQQVAQAIDRIQPLRIAFGQTMDQMGAALANFILDTERGLDQLGNIIENFVQTYLTELFNKLILQLVNARAAAGAGTVTVQGSTGAPTVSPGSSGAPLPGGGGRGPGLVINQSYTINSSDEAAVRRGIESAQPGMIAATIDAVTQAAPHLGPLRTAIKIAAAT